MEMPPAATSYCHPSSQAPHVCAAAWAMETSKWEIVQNWGPYFGVLIYAGSCNFESILSAPDFWKLPSGTSKDLCTTWAKRLPQGGG